MKENWEHSSTFTPPSPSTLHDMIHTAFPSKTIASLQRTSTGLSNGSYKFTLEQDDSPYMLRVCSGSSDVAYKEVAITQLVAATVPIAQYVHSEIIPTAEGASWSILEWKDGILLADILKTGDTRRIAAAATAVGNVLAHIHNYTFAQAGFFGPTLTIVEPLSPGMDEWCAFINDSLEHHGSGRWLHEQEIQAVRRFLQSSRMCIHEFHEMPLLVHSDFNGLNILIQESSDSTTVPAVLDWEFAFAGTRYADIGNMLRYESAGSLYEQHVLEGYRAAGGELHPQWRLLSRMEDLLALCDMLNSSTSEMPNRIADLRRLIVQTVTAD
ncbi:phosphotransferase family protein [Paenibacillus sp. WLX1005]|uniref:phosphotransferase family protein n=1 Tax=Paenibacillus sp. WLX1005 TaxID=3243766 RepID=UPI003983EB29